MNLDDVANAPRDGLLELTVWADRHSDGLEERIGRLFDEYRDPVYTHLALMLGNPAEAEEVTQEVFLRLHRQLGEGKKIRDVKPWLFRVAQNLVIDRARAARPEDSLSDETVLAQAEANQTMTAQQDPEQALLHKERCNQVREAFSRLPARQRQCMHLKAEGFRYHEIAFVLGIARSSVIENVRRAMVRLAEEFGEYA